MTTQNDAYMYALPRNKSAAEIERDSKSSVSYLLSEQKERCDGAGRKAERLLIVIEDGDSD